MDLIVKLDMDSAAFYEDAAGETERILTQVSEAVRHDSCGPHGFVKALRDSNGNIVGTMVVTL